MSFLGRVFFLKFFIYSDSLELAWVFCNQVHCLYVVTTPHCDSNHIYWINSKMAYMGYTLYFQCYWLNTASLFCTGWSMPIILCLQGRIHRYKSIPVGVHTESSVYKVKSGYLVHWGALVNRYSREFLKCLIDHNLAYSICTVWVWAYQWLPMGDLLTNYQSHV